MYLVGQVFAPIAAAGLVVSLIVHLSCLFGFQFLLGPAVWVLHGGIVIVSFPLAFARYSLQRDSICFSWSEALRGCPFWMRGMIYLSFCYFFLNLLLTYAMHATNNWTALFEIRLFSGFWILCYSTLLGLYYSYTHMSELFRRCPKGHYAAYAASHCGLCGSPLDKNEHDLRPG